MKSQSIKFVSLISLCLLAIAMLVMGVWSVTAPSLNINGDVDMAVGTNALYIKDLRIKDADDPSDTGTTFENFDPGFVHNNIPVNLGRIDRTSSFILLFDVVNTTTTYYMASTNSTVSGATLSAEGILMNSGISPTEAVTTSEISGTISLTVTLTSSSPVTLNNVVINFEETSGITVYSTDSTRGTGYATGVAMDGQTVTLNAEFTEDLEADFLGWRVGSATGEVISTLPEYTFTFNEGDPTTYYAEFTEPNTFLTYSTLTTGTVSVFRSGNTMTELTIPSMVYRTNIIASRVTEIGNYGFENCTSLQSLSIPETVTNIGYQAFRYCNSLTDITIPEGVTRIQIQTFYACVSLQNITIPNTVTSIEERAFTSCEALQNITIPSGVISIGDYAFRYCNSLATATVESFTIYEQLTSQDETVCGGMLATKAHIYVPQNIVNSYTNDYLNDTSIYVRTTSGNYYVYAKALGFTFTTSESNGTLTGYTGSDTSITIPETFSLFGDVAVAGTDYTVTAIGANAFQSSGSITEVTIADTITTIEDSAFYQCIGLTSVNFGTDSQLDIIEQRAFYMCYNLPSISLPDSLTYIGFEAFAQCYGLSSITIPANVKTVYSEAFAGCSGLTQVTIESDTVYQSIIAKDSVGGALRFSGATVRVPTTIVNTYDSTYLEDTNNYARTTSGNYYIFTKALGFTFTTSGSTATLTGYTGSATSVTIPETFSLINGVAVAGTDYTVTAIGMNAFDYNSTLRSITIPDCITSIGDAAFRFCSNLQSITIPNSVTSLGYSTFNSCINLQSVTMLGVTSIGESAFSYCTNLQNITTSDNLTSIGQSAFNNCTSLQSITLPANLEAVNIGQSAFSNCSSLETVIVESADVYEDLINEESWRGGGILRNIDARIYVPQNIVNNYTNNYLNNTSYYSRSTSGSYYVFTKV